MKKRANTNAVSATEKEHQPDGLLIEIPDTFSVDGVPNASQQVPTGRVFNAALRQARKAS
jgi:hypothetical protein